jgi:surface polysaccharide O-acyltransferase-like enzyme
VFFNVSGQFYYLVVLAVFYAGFYFLHGWTLRRLQWLAAIAFAVNLAAIAYYQSSSLHGDFATLAYRNPFVWVFFYSFGYCAGRTGSLDWTGRLAWPAFAGMGVLLTVYLVRGERFDDYPVSYFGLTVYLFSCLSLVVYPSVLRLLFNDRVGRLLTRPFCWLSRYALAIYLVHMPFFVGYLTNRLVSDSALRDDYFKLMNGLFVVGLASSLLFVLAVERVAPRFAIEFMGLEPRPGSPPEALPAQAIS